MLSGVGEDPYTWLSLALQDLVFFFGEGQAEDTYARQEVNSTSVDCRRVVRMVDAIGATQVEGPVLCLALL